MKRYKIILLFFLGGLLTLAFSGCEDQVLNKKPTESFSEQDIWNDIELVKKYVWNNYNALGGWGLKPNGRLLPAALTDDAYNLFNHGLWVYNTGNISSASLGAFGNGWGGDGIWPEKYKYIKNTNVFLENIANVKADEAQKERLKGEMKFIRAWSYAKLISRFGGVPLIEKPFELDEDFQTQRASYQDCVNWLIKELDETEKLVPQSVPSSEWGRVTKGAVLALKARVLLYAASKLHDSGTEPSGPLYDYSKNDKWKDAAEAAKAVIDLGQYSLVEVDTWKDYQQMFLHNTPEIIFAQPLSSQYRPDNAMNWDLINTPNGYNGYSGNCPTQDLVDAFQMKDGKSIGESPLYNPSPDGIYKDRELRFYADIVYQGAQYRGRETEFYLPGGLDSKDGPQNWNYARTGYTVRKYIDESVNFTSTQATTPIIYFRLAEFYLNYAEAQYHLGNEAVAREYINKIRNRVHLPDIQSSGEELLKDIRHERRIELTYEGSHRFDDVRRWMIADKELSEDAMGIAWQKVNEQGELEVGGKLTYEFIQAQERGFKKRMYYLPIPQEEMEKTDLQQNAGYQ